jgi:hypothetical protein
MRIFILTTGRSGSLTIIRACEHIENYTSAHESLAKVFGTNRLKYEDNHIEADNRLSWHLGQIDKLYGDTALYVHLKRNRDKVAHSYFKRFYYGSIMDAFCEGIRMTAPEYLNKSERLQACYDYVDTVNTNIESFMSNKTKTMTIELENIAEGFKELWRQIGANGDLEKALNEFKVPYNPSTKRKWRPLSRMKLILIREYRHILLCLNF